MQIHLLEEVKVIGMNYVNIYNSQGQITKVYMLVGTTS